MTSLSERIGVEARRDRPARLVASVVGFPFWVVGWLTFWLLAAGGAVFAATAAVRHWCWAGVRLGWQDARDLAGRRGMEKDRWPVRPKRERRGSG